MILLVACLEEVLKLPLLLEQLVIRGIVCCTQQDVALHIRHRPERNQLVVLAALTEQRWKLVASSFCCAPALRAWLLTPCNRSWIGCWM